MYSSSDTGNRSKRLELRKRKSSFSLYDPLQLRKKFSRISEIRVLKADWGDQHEFDQNMGSECTICINLKTKSRGMPPDPHLQEGVSPTAPSPCGASHRFGYAPGRKPSGSATSSKKKMIWFYLVVTIFRKWKCMYCFFVKYSIWKQF